MATVGADCEMAPEVCVTETAPPEMEPSTRSPAVSLIAIAPLLFEAENVPIWFDCVLSVMAEPLPVTVRALARIAPD